MPGTTKPTASKITIVEWKPYDKPGAIRGFITISIAPGIVIHGCKRFEKGAEAWVGWPVREYKTRNGSAAYAPIVEFASRDLEREFQQAVLAALERYLEDGHE